MSGLKIVFLVTEDWFFNSHFLPLARRAREEGFEVVLASRDSGAIDAKEGVRVLDTQFSRSALRPWDIKRQIERVRQIIADERPDIVHAIALKPIALLLLANVHGQACAFALTGRGYLAVGRSIWTKAVSWRFRHMLRRGLRSKRTILLVENVPDRHWVEGNTPLPNERVVLMPGAGVDAALLAAEPEPGGPIVVGIVSRLIRSKGIDLAVDAIRQLRGEGIDITLRVAGDADEQNPEHVDGDDLNVWRNTPGVELVGRIADIQAFWASTHIACLPSRGGEGLPRSLLEAAACGRAIVTSDAPGCVDFIAASGGGIVVPRNDVAALTNALRALAGDAACRASLAASGRAAVLAGYTEAQAAAQAAKAWRLLLES